MRLIGLASAQAASIACEYACHRRRPDHIHSLWMGV
jgi:hypothetical protein